MGEEVKIEETHSYETTESGGAAETGQDGGAAEKESGGDPEEGSSEEAEGESAE